MSLPFRVLSFTFVLLVSTSAQYSGTLQSVQIVSLVFFTPFCMLIFIVLFRHGQRAPTHYLIFPTEDPKILQNFTIEAGEMTNEGIMQEYQLGQKIRAMYDDFMGVRYVPSKLRVLTGSDNRTVVSALAVLAAMYPPQDNQVWKQFFNWQPVAVHSEPILDQFSTGALDRCPELVKTVEKTDAYRSILTEDAEFRSWLSDMTGVNVSDPIQIDRVFDTITDRAQLDDLPPPEWARNDTLQQMVIQKYHRLHTQVIELFLPQIGGWLYNLMVSAVENRINNSTNHNLILYSGHDTNIVTLGRFLSIPELDIKPAFGAFLVLEHHLLDGENIIQIWFHPSLNGTRTRLDIPGCADPCSFETFKNLKPRVSSSSWLLTCEGQAPFCDDYSVVLGAMIGLTILLGILSVLLIFICLAYRNRINKLLDEEQRSLLG